MSGRQYEDCAGRNGVRDHGKHTPGPWIAAADEDNDLGEFTVRTVDGDYIADVRNPYCDYDMQVAYARSEDCRIEADARLIAAAPELLEALKLVADSGKFSCFDDLAWDAVNAAIAKAEGRS